MTYTERTYRSLHRQHDLVHFQVMVRETDLDIGVRRERFSPELVRRTEELIYQERRLLELYIRQDPVFQTSLQPHPTVAGAPSLAVEMAEAARLAGVGPMAAVAGAFAQLAGKALTRYSRDVIVENGGDIFIKTTRPRKVGIFAGQSPFSHRIALAIQPGQTPLGICTSSGTVGHSLSFGRSDAVVILAPSAPLADAVATAAGNLVQEEADVQKAVDFAASVPGVTGAVAIKGEKLAAWGQVKLVPM
ncbi:UPF0280 family protein [Desulforamulus hydrothermalis]|uniref:ApbE family lipoprotein n=1 Tax=Desulforamulus hydrothermalis Lam5 = DSM 18033 TaxID=1121428 RepID=K8DZQ1_9FIRM|nr:UPF0280 family protein [Desulforamulus hydrothermalis]CCO08612.1 conserved hypothetical protein [Desulforamulus hydrothermalis Lam5 = DSM 18033]SHH01173.1 hypothetical protein SAMN02745177_01110 [Desulforamulus hydrothermalis Lam5 = DSM 18033]